MPAKPRTHHQEHNRTVSVVIVGGLVIVGAVVWLTGQLAGLLFAWTWLATPLGAVPGIVAGWVASWRNPAIAWPAGVRGLLPGPVGMYLCLVLVLTAPGLLATRVVRAGRRPRAGRSGRAARWASRWQLRSLAVRRVVGWAADRREALTRWAWTQRAALTTAAARALLVLPVVVLVGLVRVGGTSCRWVGLVKGAPAGRIVMGRRWDGWCRPLLAAEPCASVMVFGPPGSFKTAGLAIPAILEWVGAVVATSIKPDLIHATLDHRSDRGQVWIFNPLQAAGLPSNSWSPLASCRTWAGAKEMGAWLATAADVTGLAKDAAHYWSLLGAKLLAVLLYAAAGTGRPMADVVRWVDLQEQPEIDDALAELGEPVAADAWDACKAREERTRSSVYGTAETLLEVYADPRVAHACTGCEIDLELLLGGDHTLYLYAPAHQQRRLRPLFVALLTAVARAAQERAACSPGGMLNPRLLLCLDEAGNIAAIPDLPELATTGRGQGIQLLSILHDYGQLQRRYGSQAATVVNGHRAKLFLSGQADLGSLKLASELIGDAAVTDTAVSLGAQRRSRTVSQRYRPLAPPERIRQLKGRQAVLVYGHLPPVRVRLRAWWRTPGLRRRGGGQR